MDKRFKNILKETDFSEKYIELYEKNKNLVHNKNLTLEDKKAILSKINSEIEFSYFKKENFFQWKETIKEFDCIFNIAISDTRIEFILFFQNPKLKFKDGGPFGLLAKRLNPKIPNYYKIPYSNEKDLLLSLKKGYKLYNDIKGKVITIEK